MDSTQPARTVTTNSTHSQPAWIVMMDNTQPAWTVIMDSTHSQPAWTGRQIHSHHILMATAEDSRQLDGKVHGEVVVIRT